MEHTLRILLTAILTLYSFNAFANIKVIDGDSIIIDNIEYRLSGIDAPEYHQTCFDVNKKEYACGQLSRQALIDMVDDSINCDVLLIDKYKRKVAICWMGDININKKMVELGWAVAYKRYTDDYNEAEQNAKNAKLGIWQGRFLTPEFYRILKKEKNKLN